MELSVSMARLKRSLAARRKNRRRIWAMVVSLGLLIPLPMAIVPTHSASAAEQEYLSQEYGFDACKTPTTAQMQAWWSNSPYFNYFGYLGGDNASNCGGATFNNTWVQTVDCANCGLYPTMEWDVGFFWVGPQHGVGDLCESSATQIYNYYIGTNTTSAYQSGYQNAVDLYQTVQTDGFNYVGMPLTYDLEGYNDSSTCRAAASAFMQGFADYLHAPPAQMVGVYGSTCSSELADFSSDGDAPDYIHGADPSTGYHTSTMSCVPSNLWTNHQRQKQYSDKGTNVTSTTHAETYGGVTLTIDNDCSDGPVYGQFYQQLSGTCL